MTKLLDYHTYVETDYSRFDMTISVEWLELVQNTVFKMFFPDDYLFHSALDLCTKTKGVAANGLVYNVLGTRCSGDAHTSIGNGILNAFNLDMLYDDLLPDIETDHDAVRFYCEGDDGVLALDKPHSHLADRVHLLNIFGFVVKAMTTSDINSVSFCGRFLYDSCGKIRSYCDPLRTLSKLHITLSCGKLEELLLAKCMSYAHTDGDTPIIGPICETIRGQLLPRLNKRVMRYALRDRYLFTTAKPVFKFTNSTISDDTRNSFALRTGISPAMQIYLEEYYITAFKTRIPLTFHQIEFGQEVLAEKESSVVHVIPALHDHLTKSS